MTSERFRISVALRAHHKSACSLYTCGPSQQIVCIVYEVMFVTQKYDFALGSDDVVYDQ
jgi:hypothetical protein